MRKPLLFGSILLLFACQPAVNIDDIVTGPLFVPPNGTLDDQSLVVPKGRVLSFVAQPMEKGETLKERIRLTSLDRGIAGVETTVEMNQFVVYGVGLGTTTLTITDESGQEAELTFTVRVIEP